ncbi:MAG TPA: universal stress protein [Conexibacter sp.]|nr:universal stress protein [Conexibacter sp.]
MVTKILVGFDRSPHAADALTLGAVLARASGARLAAGCVYAYPMLSVEDDDLAVEIRAHAERVAASAAELAPELTIEPHTIEDSSPADGLQRLAADIGADLLVVGSSRRGPVGRAFAGSVPEQLLHAAACAVAIAPSRYAEAEHHRLADIGVGFDGSREARAAVTLAEQLARRTGADLRVIGVAGMHAAALVASPFAAAQYDSYLRQIRDREEAMLRGIVETLEVDATAEPHLGDPISSLGARSSELDLLLIGSRAYGTLRRLFTGSVATALIRGVACPLLVLPRGSAPPA